MSDSPTKKGLLWNVLEPGDNYEIRKSLIARMPGDRKIFMGDHVDMVCLFQAAEIQRLIQYLNDYKLKFKEVERNQFDKHSYQTQIKQLLEMNADSESLRIEVTKLREFIRRQSDELEFERNKNKEVDQSLRSSYNQALSRIQQLLSEKEQYVIKTSQLENNLASWKARYQALDKTRLRQLNEVRQQVQRQSQLDREIKQMNSRFNSQRSQYQSQIRHLKEQIENRIKELGQLQIQISETNRSASFQQNEFFRNQETRDLKFKEEIQFLNSSLVKKSMQLQQLTIKHQTLLTQNSRSNNELQDVSKRLKKYQDQNHLLNISIQKLHQKLNERVGSDGKLQEAQNQLALLSQQIARLEYMNTSKSKQAEQWVEKYNKLGYEYQSLRIQYLNISNRLAQIESTQANTQQLHTSIMRMTQQNSTLKRSLQNNQDNSRKLYHDLQSAHMELKNVSGQLLIFSDENQRFKMKINELTSALDDSHKGQRNVAELEKRIRMLENQKDYAIRQTSELSRALNDMQTSQNHSLTEEYERKLSDLKGVLESERKRSTVQRQTYQERMRALTDSHQEELRAVHSQLDFSRRNLGQQSELLRSNYSKAIEERDSLNQIAHQLQDRLRSFGGQERIIRFNEQIQRLNKKLREKNDQASEYQRRLKDLDQFKVKYDGSLHQIQALRRKIQLLEPVQNKEQEYKIISLTKQVESLKKQLDSQDFKARIVDYQKRVTLFSDEIDRLNEINDKLRQQNQEWREKYSYSCHQKQKLDQIAHQLQQKLRITTLSSNDVSSLRIQNQEYQSRLGMLLPEIASLKQTKVKLQRIRQQQQNEINILNLQIERLKKGLNDQLSIQNQFEQKLTIMSKEIQRLNEVLEGKVGESQKLQRQLGEVNGYKQSIRIYEEENTKLSENVRVLQRQIVGLDDEIRASTVGLHSLKAENDSLRRQIADFDIRSREFEEVLIDREQLKRRLEEKNNELASINANYKSLSKDIERITQEMRSRQSSSAELIKANSQFNQKFILISQQNDRTKFQRDELSRKNGILELSIQKLNSKIQLLNIKVQEVDSYALRDQKYKQEIQRINQSVIIKESQIAGLQKTLTDLELAKQRGLLSIEQLQRVKAKNNQLMSKILEYESRVFGHESELQTIKSKLQYSEDKVRGFQQAEDQHSALIREKDQAIYLLKNEINQYSQKTIIINSEWNIKIVNLQDRCRSLELEKSTILKQLEQARMQKRRLEDFQRTIQSQWSQEWSAKQRQLRLQMSELQQNITSGQMRISGLQSERASLQNRITSYQFQMSTLKKKVGMSASEANEMSRLRDQLREVTIQKDGYQTRLIAVGNEVQRLNRVLQLKIQDIELANRRVNQMTLTIQQNRIKITQLIGENDGLQLIISQLNTKLASHDSTINRIHDLKIQEKNAKIREYEDKLALLSQQIQRLEGMKRAHISKIQFLQTRLLETQNDSSQYQDKILTLTRQLQRLNVVLRNKLELEQQISWLKSETDRLQKSLRQKSQAQANASVYLHQIQRLNNTLRIKVQQSKEMESSRLLNNQNDAKIATYSQQIERLNRQLKVKIEENKTLKHKIVQINRDTDELREKYSQAIRDYENSKRRYLDLQEKMPRLNAEFESLNGVLRGQKQQITILKQENYNLKVQLTNGSSQSVEEKNKMLAQEITRLNKIIQEHMQEISQLRLRYVDQNALEKRINEHLSLFVVLFAEIESLRKRVKDKEKQVIEVRRSSLATYIVNGNGS